LTRAEVSAWCRFTNVRILYIYRVIMILSFCPLIIPPRHRVECWCKWPTNQDGRPGLLKQDPNHDNCTTTPMNRLLAVGPCDRGTTVSTGQDDPQQSCTSTTQNDRGRPSTRPRPCEPLLAGWITGAGNQRQAPTTTSTGDDERMTMRSGTTDTGTTCTTDPTTTHEATGTGRRGVVRWITL
jgi:hypothetical protein